MSYDLREAGAEVVHLPKDSEEDPTCCICLDDLSVHGCTVQRPPSKATKDGRVPATGSSSVEPPPDEKPLAMTCVLNPCLHRYHYGCFAQYSQSKPKRARASLTCPLCRQSVVSFWKVSEAGWDEAGLSSLTPDDDDDGSEDSSDSDDEELQHICPHCDSGEREEDLLLCDGFQQTCPNAAHYDCLDLERIPSGSWFCNHCNELETLSGAMDEVTTAGSPTTPRTQAILRAQIRAQRARENRERRHASNSRAAQALASEGGGSELLVQQRRGTTRQRLARVMGELQGEGGGGYLPHVSFRRNMIRSRRQSEFEDQRPPTPRSDEGEDLLATLARPTSRTAAATTATTTTTPKFDLDGAAKRLRASYTLEATASRGTSASTSNGPATARDSNEDAPALRGDAALFDAEDKARELKKKKTMVRPSRSLADASSAGSTSTLERLKAHVRNVRESFQNAQPAARSKRPVPSDGDTASPALKRARKRPSLPPSLSDPTSGKERACIGRPPPSKQLIRHPQHTGRASSYRGGSSRPG